MKPVLVRKSETALQQVPSGGLQLVVGGKGPSIRELAGMAFGRKTGQKGQGWQRLGAIADLAGRGLSAAATTQQIADQMQGGNLAAPMGAYAQYLANQPWQFIERQKQGESAPSPAAPQAPDMQPVAPGSTAPDGSPLPTTQMMLPIDTPQPAQQPTQQPTQQTLTPPAEAAAAMTGQPVQPQPAQPAAAPAASVPPAQAAEQLRQQGQTGLFDSQYNRSAEPFEHAMDYLLKRLSR